MTYIAPTEACAGGFEPVEILYDGGEGEWAVARAETGALGIRWNGSGEKPIGFPSSHGKAEWFIVPDQIAAAVAALAVQCR